MIERITHLALRDAPFQIKATKNLRKLERKFYILFLKEKE